MTVFHRLWRARPVDIEAVRVGFDLNIREAAEWCDGKVMERVPGTGLPGVRPKGMYREWACKGDWIARDQEGRYQIFTDKAFRAGFIQVVEDDEMPDRDYP